MTGSGFAHLEVSDPTFPLDGLRFATIDSPALGGRGDVSFWWPEDTDPAAALPLVVLLHGVYGSAWAWAAKAGAHRTAARLVEAGEIPPVVVAMPSDGLWRDGSGYVAHGGGGPDAASWIADDVLRLASLVAPYDVDRSPAVVAGLSMGGWGALRLGATRPDRFRASYGLSSITNFGEMSQFVATPLDGYGFPQDEWDVGTAMAAAAATTAAGPVAFRCGTEDPLVDGNRALHRRLDAAGVAHDYTEDPGGHEWPYWERHLPDVLGWFAANGVLT